MLGEGRKESPRARLTPLGGGSAPYLDKGEGLQDAGIRQKSSDCAT